MVNLLETRTGGAMDSSFTMKGPLRKWTNVVNGWQFRWFVLDFNVGVLFYYTSIKKMNCDDRRGSLKLKNAQVGIDDEDDSTFTLTVDHRTFHFQARDSNERQKWLDALQEARDLHTPNYALLHHANRLLDHPSALSDFDRRIVEADTYLQILIDQHQDIGTRNAEMEECSPQTLDAVRHRLQSLIELVKKTIVSLQFAKESVLSGYNTLLPVNRVHYRFGSAASYPDVSSTSFHEPGFSSGSRHVSPSITKRSSGQSGEGDGLIVEQAQQSIVSSSAPHRTPSADPCRPLSRIRDSSRPSSLNSIPLAPELKLVAPDTLDSNSVQHDTFDLSARFSDSEPSTRSYTSISKTQTQLAPNGVPLVSYAWSEGSRSMSGNEDEEEFFDTHEELSPRCSPIRSQEPIRQATQISVNNQQFFIQTDDDQFDELYDVQDEDLGSVKSHDSVIKHLLSQLRIGMDLTKITLPTFILERRSTLEMYADFLAHADLWAAIPDAPTPRDRMIACLRWYLSSFHAGRRSSIAKKPYNPILGEVFRCYWTLPPDVGSYVHDSDNLTTNQRLRKSGPVSWAQTNSVVFLAEQVSHHPPISAFYAEHVGQRISLDGHLCTKSKFLGLSIAVEMVGSAVISLLNLDEEYIVTFPCGYGRNIFSVPWVELGGKTSIVCSKSGYSANIEFKTKPFYSSKKDLIHAELNGPIDQKPILVVDGEWNGKMIARWEDGKNEVFLDTRTMPVLKKQVLPRTKQAENESRRLWEHVTKHLKDGDIDAATNAKCRLEQTQRELARSRTERNLSWLPEHFRAEGSSWIYRNPLVHRIGEFTIGSSFTAPVLSSSTQQTPSAELGQSDFSE